MRRALAVVAFAALAAPVAALAETQQVLLPGPTPYPTVSPPLVTVAAPPWATLTFKIHASSEQRVNVGTGAGGRPVALRVLQRLRLTGTGDYLIVVSAPVLDVRPGPGSQSQPGLRRGQILWSGFSSSHKLLAADATLRRGPAEQYLPLRLEARREGDRYTLTVENATRTPQVAFQGAASAPELAKLLDRTRKESLAHVRLTSEYVTIDGLVSQRPEKAQIVAPLRVGGELRFPSAPSSARGGTVHGRTVSFAVVLGDGRPLVHRVEVSGGGGDPRLHVEARPTSLVHALVPPGARRWAEAQRRRPLPAKTLLKRLLDARMDLVRSDQYQSFLSNPDPQGRNRTVYVYESAASARAAPSSRSASSGGGGALMLLLAVGGSVLAAGAAVVAWAHS